MSHFQPYSQRVRLSFTFCHIIKSNLLYRVIFIQKNKYSSESLTELKLTHIYHYKNKRVLLRCYVKDQQNVRKNSEVDKNDALFENVTQI